MRIPTPRLPLPDGLVLVARRPGGPELAVAELAVVPEGDTSQDVADRCRSERRSGVFGPDVIGVVVARHGRTRLSPREVAVGHARGTLTSLTKQTVTWSALRVRDRQLAGRLVDTDDFDHALRTLIR